MNTIKIRIKEFFALWKNYSFSYACYSILWWFCFYIRPPFCGKISTFAINKKTKWLDRYFKNNYQDIINKYLEKNWQTKEIESTHIWVSWGQGEENMPPLVKACYRQLTYYNKNVILLTNDNIKEYIDIPPIVYKKVSTGHVSWAHFSDITRNTLLARYGGLWLDATVWVGGKIPFDKLKNVEFFSANGKVPASNLVTVTSSYRGSSGYAEDVHELDPNHDEILKQNQVITVAESLLQFGTTDYSDLTFELPNSPSAEKAKATKGRSESGTEEKTEMEPSVKQVSTQSSKQENTNNSTKKSTATQGNVQVTLEQVGTRTSKVHYNGKTHEVPTAELNFGGDVPEGKETGVIYAPNTGKASLRSKASSSATVLRKCKAGTVVTVLDWGNNYCKINYKGSVGYVLTDCLLFPSADQEVLGTAQLSYNGRTTGSTTINVRNPSSGDSAKIAEWPTGTEVEVFGLENGWYEIEYDGIHGFVMEKFLTSRE